MGEYQASRIHRVYYCFPSINTIFLQSYPVPINCIKAPILELWNSRTVLFSARKNKFSKKRMIMILVGSNSIFVFQVLLYEYKLNYHPPRNTIFSTTTIPQNRSTKCSTHGGKATLNLKQL
jgi:hypothetical protein